MDGFLWAVEQVPSERLTSIPPAELGEWTVARHIFHLYFYENTVSYYYMREWLKKPSLYSGDFDEEKAWIETGQTLTIPQLLQQFREAREAQIALLPHITENLWHEIHPTGFSLPHDLKWIITESRARKPRLLRRR
jgi:hypothetical protein